MQEDAKMINLFNKVITKKFSSWKCIMETELQKQHIVSPQAPSLKEAGKKDSSLCHQYMHKCHWKFFRKTMKNLKSQVYWQGILLHVYLNKASQAEEFSTQ